ncbi:MAG: NAD+ synthase [Methanobacteriota archaeon]|nr:MAG: NAD+ synthase [Euryarchaeota archaeon]
MAALEPRFREDHVGIVTSFIRHHLAESGARGIVLGMSGGVDSSLVAALCVRAVGSEKVVGIWGGEGPAKGADFRDASEWAKALAIDLERHDIAPLVRAFERSLTTRRGDRNARGNVKARIRMIILYYIANTQGRIVMGTGNKSEIAVGYFTKFGDGGVDFLPIGDLYKTQVREMASFLGVPKRIVEKVPTAGLWKGQTDEGELGIAYADLDRVLLGIEIHLSAEEIAGQTGIALKKVRRVEDLVSRSAHKRKPPLIPKVGIRTFGLDWRE